MSLHTQYEALSVSTILFFFLFLRHTVTEITMTVAAAISTTTTPLTPTMVNRAPLLRVATDTVCVFTGDGSVAEDLDAV